MFDFNKTQFSWITSLSAKNVSDNLAGIFLSFYIWQTTNSLIAVLTFSFWKIIIIPISGTIASYLSVKTNPKTVYRLGLVIELIMLILIILFNEYFINNLSLFGAIKGLAIGMYAVPLNTINNIVSENIIERVGSLRSSIENIIKVFVPSSGAFLISISDNYLYVFGISSIFIMLASFAVYNIFVPPKTNQKFELLKLFKPSSFNKDKIILTLVYFLNGFKDGFLWVLGGIIVLKLVGGMTEWGIYNIGLSIFGVVMGVIVTKYLKYNINNQLIGLSGFSFSVSCLLLGVYYNFLSLVLFSVTLIFANIISSSSLTGFLNRIIRSEYDYDQHKNEYFSYVEYPLAFGRIIPVGLLLLYQVDSLDNIILRTIFILIGLIPLLVVTVAKISPTWIQSQQEIY